MSLGIRGELGIRSSGGGASLPAPQVTVGTVTASVIPLSWAAVEGALDYSVYVREVYPDPVEEWTEVATGIVGTSQSIADLDPAPHRYEWDVRARIQSYTSTKGETETAEAPAGLTQWTLMKSGGMDLTAATIPTRTYTWRVKNIDSEPISEVVFEFGSIHATTAPILGMAISVGGSGNSPGAGGWIRCTFGGNTGRPPLQGELESPLMVGCDPIVIPGNWQVGQAIVGRITFGAGQQPFPTRARAEEISWPDSNLSRNADGDYASTDELLATTPTWSGLNGATAYYAIRTKRVTAIPHIITHNDSVNVGIRPVASNNSASGYGWHMILNNLSGNKYRVSSLGHGGTTVANSAARNPEILARHGSIATHLMIPSWGGGGSPVSIADCDRIKANILEMEAQALAIGLKVWCVTLKPHGGTISSAGEIEAYWHMVAWADARYGVRHINLSQETTLSADGGLTLLNSEDNIHFNYAGQQAQAAAMKPRFEAALLAEGYTL